MLIIFTRTADEHFSDYLGSINVDYFLWSFLPWRDKLGLKNVVILKMLAYHGECSQRFAHAGDTHKFPTNQVACIFFSVRL